MISTLPARTALKSNAGYFGPGAFALAPASLRGIIPKPIAVQAPSVNDNHAPNLGPGAPQLKKFSRKKAVARALPASSPRPPCALGRFWAF